MHGMDEKDRSETGDTGTLRTGKKQDRERRPELRSTNWTEPPVLKTSANARSAGPCKGCNGAAKIVKNKIEARLEILCREEKQEAVARAAFRNVHCVDESTANARAVSAVASSMGARSRELEDMLYSKMLAGEIRRRW